MKKIVLQYNLSLQNMAIFLIINIKDKDKESVKKIFESFFYLLGFEATRNVFEGIYLLITNKSVIIKAQK